MKLTQPPGPIVMRCTRGRRNAAATNPAAATAPAETVATVTT
ncbi:MAG TPA: hypothetical protein VGL02_07330 [Streptomyces sp.]